MPVPCLVMPPAVLVLEMTPEKVNDPLPDMVNVLVPSVTFALLFVLVSPAIVLPAVAAEISKVALPTEIVELVRVPVSESVPALMVVVPEKPFVPLMVKVPAPDLVTLPVPVILPE